MPSVIETHPKKQEIIDALLEGQSLRKVAAMAGVSHTQVDDYKKRVLLPSLERASTIAKLEQLAASAQTEGVDVQRVTDLTRAVASVSERSSGSGLAAKWFERHEGLYSKALDLYEKSLAAQRVYTDKDGKQVFAGQDFSAPTGVLNQLHRNQELLGKAAGLMRDGDSGGVRVENMLVVLPRVGSPGPVAEPSAAIDTTAEPAEEPAEPAEPAE